MQHLSTSNADTIGVRTRNAGGRPRLSLSDVQAGQLARSVSELLVRHAHSPRQHRPFVHDFVRAVFLATGMTYSAAFYRKLLAAYAPDRTPSTATIEAEKKLLTEELQRRALPDAQMAPPCASPTAVADAAHAVRGSAPADLAQQEILGLVRQIAARGDQPSRIAPDRAPGLQTHNDYLRERLAAAEAELTTLRAATATLFARNQEQAALAGERGALIEKLHKSADEQTAVIAKLGAQLAGAQSFMAVQVDAVRGETRAVREQCEWLKGKNKELEQQLETYRNLVLRRGAPVP